MNRKRTSGPLVSVGVPCFNSGMTITKCLDSIATQSYNNLEILISDNCSTDTTRSAIIKFQQSHPNVKIIWHTQNRGAHANFLSAIEASSGEYFMFLASDDSLGDEDYVEKLVSCIESHNDCIAAMPSVYFVNGTELNPSRSTRSIIGSLKHRLKDYLSTLPHDNPHCYSLYNKETLLKALKTTRVCHAADWVVVIKALVHGGIRHCPEAGLYREVTPLSTYAKSVSRDNHKWLTFGQPMLPFILQAAASLPMRYAFILMPEFLRINRVKRQEYHFLHRQ